VGGALDFVIVHLETRGWLRGRALMHRRGAVICAIRIFVHQTHSLVSKVLDGGRRVGGFEKECGKKGGEGGAEVQKGTILTWSRVQI